MTRARTPASPAPPRRSRRARWLAPPLGLLLAVATLVGAELLLRASGLAPPEAMPSPLGSSHDITLEGELADPPERRRRCGGKLEVACLRDAPGLRVSVYGGSAVQGLPYSPLGAFPAWLQRDLATLAGGTPVEVLNHGTAGHGSRQIRWRVARDLPIDRPDLLVVYSGNNEFWELAAWKRGDGASAWRVDLRHRLWELAGYRLLRRFLAPEPPPAIQPQGDGAREPVHFDRADRRLATRLYARNLEAVVRSAQRAGVPVLLATVADNLRYLQPPQGAPRTSDEDRAAMDGLQRRLAQGEDGLEAWLASLDGRTLGHETRHAMGMRLLEAGHPALAKRQLEEAEYLTPDPMRSNYRMRQALLAVAARSGAASCDTAEALAARSPDGIPGDAQFRDWCHPTPEAHRELARILTGCILDQQLLPLAEARRFPQLPSTREVVGPDRFRLDHWPGTRERASNGAVEACLAGQTAVRPEWADGRPDPAVRAEMPPGLLEACQGHQAFIQDDVDPRQALGHYRAALAAGAPEPSIRASEGLLLRYLGELEGSRDKLEAALEALPEDPWLRNELAILTPRSTGVDEP
jgi:hypothetical protein